MKRPSLPRRPRIIAFAARWTNGLLYRVYNAWRKAAAREVKLRLSPPPTAADTR